MAFFQKVRIVFHISQKIFQISILNDPEFEIWKCITYYDLLQNGYISDSSISKSFVKFIENHYLGLVETAGNLNSYLQTLKKCGKIQTTNANKLKIEKRNIFWATEKYRTYLPKLLDL